MLRKYITKYRKLSVEVKASVAYTVCNVLQRSMSFVTLPLFTRLLTTQEYGQSTVYTSWESLITLVITLNLAYGSFSSAMIKFEQERGMYIASVNGLCTVLAAIFLMIYLPFKNNINRFLELPTFMVIYMVVSIVCSNSLQCWYGKERFEYKYKKVVFTTLLTTILSPIVAYILIIGASEKGYAKIVGTTISTLFLGAICYIYFIKKEKIFFNKKFWKYTLGFNIPLIPYYLSQIIFNQSDRIMISHLEGTDKAAIYGVAYTIGITLNIVLSAINNSYVPWFYNRIKEGKCKENRVVSSGIALLMALLLFGVISVTPEIIYILASKEYMEAIWVVPPVAMSLLFLFYTQLFVNVEFYYEEKKMLVFGTVFSAILNIILNIAFIPLFGYIAAGYTTLFSYIVFTMMHFKMYKALLKKHGLLDDMFDYKLLIVIAICFMGIGFLMMALYAYIYVRYIIVLMMILLIWYNREKIISIYRTFKD